MPVEIISGPTKPAMGEINNRILMKMKDDFINEAEVKPYNGRTRLIKKFSVSVMKDEIKNLIAYYEQEEAIDIITFNCAIHMNPFSACNDIDYADSLTIVVEAAQFVEGDPALGHVSHNAIGDFVVISGYSSINKHGWSGGPCCPSSNP